MNTFVLTAFMLGLVVCQVLSQDQFYGFNEPACLRRGGLCIKNTECESFVSEDGLCAAQRAGGYECCYGLPKSETRCEKRGGECYESNHCAAVLVYKEATDCAANEECCILV